MRPLEAPLLLFKRMCLGIHLNRHTHVTHFFLFAALSLSLLKPIEIERMGDGGHLCLKLALRALLLQCGQHSLEKLVRRIAGADAEMADLRAGLW